MLRFATFALAVALAAPAVAGTYTAKPTAPASQGRIVARDIVWRCGPDACQGTTEYGRPLLLCQGLAKRAGRMSSFIANGRAFAPAELDKCNAAARDGVGGSLAEAR